MGWGGGGGWGGGWGTAFYIVIRRIFVGIESAPNLDSGKLAHNGRSKPGTERSPSSIGLDIGCREQVLSHFATNSRIEGESFVKVIFGSLVA